jgi:ABC-type lipopolysaccharide export system ATPase subunit
MENNLLIVDSICKSFDDKHILQDIYVKMHTGDIVGIFGRNGSGKSTLLKIIFGTLEAESKFVKVGDKTYDSVFKEKSIMKYLPQEDFLPKQLKVKDIIKMYIDKDKIENIENDVVIEKIMETRVKNLSGGELRYLEIKLLINLESKCLLLDEPFNGVSPILVEEIKKMITEYSSSRGVILTDHDYKNVISIANRMYLIGNGVLRELSNKDELIYFGYLPTENV